MNLDIECLPGTGFVNVYPADSVKPEFHKTRDSADSYACEGRVACLPVEIDARVGHGL